MFTSHDSAHMTRLTELRNVVSHFTSTLHSVVSRFLSYILRSVVG
jgi:hypothetical protein